VVPLQVRRSEKLRAVRRLADCHPRDDRSRAGIRRSLWVYEMACLLENIILRHLYRFLPFRRLAIFVASLTWLWQAGCLFCVLEGTQISTPNGNVPVEKLRVGQTVVSMSPDGREFPVRVVAISSALVLRNLELRVEGIDRVLAVTAGHPIATEWGWVEAGMIRAGDMIRTRQGLRKVVHVSVRRGTRRAYDVTIGPDGCFFAENVFVNNKSLLMPPTVDRVAGTYFGYLSNGPQWFCRLRLSPNMRGLCAIGGGGWTRTSLYEVESWKLTGARIEISLCPISASGKGRTMTMVGQTYGGAMNLEVRMLAYPGKYDRFHLELFPEREFESMLVELRQAMSFPDGENHRRQAPCDSPPEPVEMGD